MTITIDAQLFIKYDDNGREIRALSGVSRRHAAAVDECDKTAQRLASAKQYLGKAAQDEAKLRKHIEQGKRHPIYSHTLLQPQTWFKGGVKSRLASREQALALTEQKEQACRKKEEELKARMPLLKKAERTLDADEQRRDELEAERTALYEAAVSAAPTAALKSLQSREARARFELKSEEALAQTLASVSRLCDEARGCLGHSGQLMRAALGMNRAQMVGNLFDGPGGGFDAMEGMEMMGQAMRNARMRQAQVAAERGAALLAQAFSLVPAAVRSRYPGVASSLGAVEVPLLRQNGVGNLFLEVAGGDLGDLLGGMGAGAKIRQNLGMIEDAAATAEAQHAAVQALLASLARDAAAAKAALHETARAVAIEKDAIFRGLRAAHGVPEDPDAATSEQLPPIPEAVPIAIQPPAAAVQIAVPVAADQLHGAAAVPLAQHYPCGTEDARAPVWPQQPVSVVHVRRHGRYYEDDGCVVM